MDATATVGCKLEYFKLTAINIFKELWINACIKMYAYHMAVWPNVLKKIVC
jgi:hypothetical protein